MVGLKCINKTIINPFPAGQTIWECRLSLPVAPDKCRIRPAGRNRVEIRLKKATPSWWEELRNNDYSDDTDV